MQTLHCLIHAPSCADDILDRRSSHTLEFKINVVKVIKYGMSSNIPRGIRAVCWS